MFKSILFFAGPALLVVLIGKGWASGSDVKAIGLAITAAISGFAGVLIMNKWFKK